MASTNRKSLKNDRVDLVKKSEFGTLGRRKQSCSGDEYTTIRRKNKSSDLNDFASIRRKKSVSAAVSLVFQKEEEELLGGSKSMFDIPVASSWRVWSCGMPFILSQSSSFSFLIRTYNRKSLSQKRRGTEFSSSNF
jgi:hypothetical protein